MAGFFNHFGQIADRLPKALSEIVTETTEQFGAEAQARAPVDTGRLRASMRTDYVERDGVLHGRVHFDAENQDGENYAIPVEVGTIDTSAQPFIGPAAEIVKPAFVTKLEGLEGRLR